MYLFEGLEKGGPYGYFSLYRIADQQEKHLRGCCLELLDFDQECRCQAINQVVKQPQDECGGWPAGEVMMQDIVRKAINLPDRCYISPRQCIIRSSSFFPNEESSSCSKLY
ncbi:hypothetical protein ACH5RR_027932 [Cinchona calisaya]|uniref:Bifunctional inhibitor/plant lipid transfer protein/seed storage helical domain-containing protein n=1 Tax=Cinchona calisaya TaxID=153742 RepID=A0ABD2YNN8_9GENT